MAQLANDWKLDSATTRSDGASAESPCITRASNNRLLSYFRARYYDPTTGEFTSPDPLEYVDGMSLYRGYFVMVGMDPKGTDLAGCDDGCPQIPPNIIAAYGCFCGANNPPAGVVPNGPLDPLDNCCKAHDPCYAKHNCGIYIPFRRMSPECDECDRVFCRCLRFAPCNRHPVIPQLPNLPNRTNCENYKLSAMKWFQCERRFGVLPPPPFII
jgi:hypothetical protein